MRILHSEPSFLTALISAQISLLQTVLSPETILEMTGSQLDDSLSNVIWYNLVSPRYKQQRDIGVTCKVIPVHNCSATDHRTRTCPSSVFSR